MHRTRHDSRSRNFAGSNNGLRPLLAISVDLRRESEAAFLTIWPCWETLHPQDSDGRQTFHCCRLAHCTPTLDTSLRYIEHRSQAQTTESEGRKSCPESLPKGACGRSCLGNQTV
ncbi:uncharacterized protein PV09_03402 [Verruconis gallopava]|uniref:Uncharacterized protein n=1 Tax=Verruconis gallopava TaxID=253628 RepID=A0A0D1XS52_9PEZI|nr:uncharacterized protein PV09_03402 [Verruconis gallopava]KIW05521.1 hypothetical protein PV09_03402 [Verruconis gallopava]